MPVLILVEPTVAVPPPDDGAPGCVLCGVGSLPALRSERDEVWVSKRWMASILSLGGSLTAEPVHGYICPRDTTIVNEVGGLGPTSVERAYAAFLGETLPVGWELTEVRAWISLPPGTPPNSTPWEHQPDHDAVRESVREMREKARRGLVRIE